MNVSIIGMGLLGASLGLALKGAAGVTRLCWARRGEVRDWAVANGAADWTSESLEDVIRCSDVTFLTLPIPCILEFLEKYASVWKAGSIVTDIGSVKSEICACAEKFLCGKGVIFVGSHPMAGTEKSGPENAFAELYSNSDVFITPTVLSTPEAEKVLSDLWLASGARRTVVISPREHDALVAHTSHVLHVVASALSLTILGSSDEREKSLRFAGCATGFRDTSRIASSNPVMWREIIEHNTPEVLTALENFENELFHLRKLISDGDYDCFEKEFARGKMLRDSWLEYKRSSKK